MAFTPTPRVFRQTSPEARDNIEKIAIRLAPPEQIIAWSKGEVTKPETINYRSQRPEKDGLFCEKIFGPQRDYECYCGRYKRQRDRQRRSGFDCESCGVLVGPKSVRRERMGHIQFADPVAHIWFTKGTPARIPLVLDIQPKLLEKVIYFQSFIVTDVNEEERQRALESFEIYREQELEAYEEERRLEVMQDGADDFLSQLMIRIADEEGQLTTHGVSVNAEEREPEEKASIEKVIEIKMEYWRELFNIKIDHVIERLNDLHVKMTLTESDYANLKFQFGDVFQADMGAGAVRTLLENVNLNEIKEDLIERIRSSSGQKRDRAVKRLAVIEAFINSDNKPEHMVLLNIPVLPPDLHPMVPLDGGRYATSDLNDLYRRVINRNNRLKHLKKLAAPQIILRNERRMLQEAVDALIDNGRHGRPVVGRHNHKLKSLTDLLRGKQGRFRQNLLGKRVDYSGRSVIIVGPDLKLDQCGLPKKMALELFKPFVMSYLIKEGHAPNIKTAKRRTDEADSVVWDALETVVENHPVLLNRAPTLHRMGIQAFYPRLVEGSAIQLHPLVCTAFNADFDGDQMAVHVPLSFGAKREAEKLMLSTRNMLAPRSGLPIVTPTLDMLLGIYFLTGDDVKHEALSSMDEAVAKVADEIGSEDHSDVMQYIYRDEAGAVQVHQAGKLGLRERIYVRMAGGLKIHSAVGESDEVPKPYAWVRTTVGRIIFNEILKHDTIVKAMNPEESKKKDANKAQTNGHALVGPANESVSAKTEDDGVRDSSVNGHVSKEGEPEQGMGYYNCWLREDDVEEIVSVCFGLYKHEGTAAMLDEMKKLGFEYAMRSGTTIAIKDAVPPGAKAEIVSDGQLQANSLSEQFEDGLITEEERSRASVELWTQVTDDVTNAVKKHLSEFNGVFAMSDSGAKGNLQQIRQMAGMRGLMTAPNKQWSTEASIIDTPVISSLSDGLSVHEYFASTHGSRKALTDTALKTAEAGYLTRRMSDAAQDVIIADQNAVDKATGKTWDCGTNFGVKVAKSTDGDEEVSFEERLYGRYPASDILHIVKEVTKTDPITGEPMLDPDTGDEMTEQETALVAPANELIDRKTAAKVAESRLKEDFVELRSPEHCMLDRGICVKCTGGMKWDCETNVGIRLSKLDAAELNIPFDERVFGRYPLHDIVDDKTGEVLATTVDLIDREIAKKIADANLEGDAVEVRSPVGCILERGVCATCYGEMLANNRPSIPGEAVGIVAAQSIGEPGTQLTMRNFHTGGTAAGPDITTGLPRVQELLEARTPKTPALLSEIAGECELREEGGEEVIVVKSSDPREVEIEVRDGYKITVNDGDWIDAGSAVAELTARGRKSLTNADGVLTAEDVVESSYAGVAEIDGDTLKVKWEEVDERSYPVPLNSEVVPLDGDMVEPGDELIRGQSNPHHVLELKGIPAVRNYLVDEAQRVYRSQGVKVHDKHFEVVVRQMLSRVEIVTPGDTTWSITEVVSRREFEETNRAIAARGGEVAESKPVLLGISKAALSSSSFLARASFQETERVLSEAATQGMEDYMHGLKECVIIGRMIPADLSKSAEGRRLLGVTAEEEQAKALGGTGQDDWEQALTAVAFGGDQLSPATEQVVFKPTAEIGFTDEDDYEPDSEDLADEAAAFIAVDEMDERPTIGFDDE